MTFFTKNLRDPVVGFVTSLVIETIRFCPLLTQEIEVNPFEFAQTGVLGTIIVEGKVS